MKNLGKKIAKILEKHWKNTLLLERFLYIKYYLFSADYLI